ncbi:MAG: roadblock/LC7 domain-containing protein [Candidatus Bathyarchaeota archaeon]|nr:MAG: roadblock/LC7 domain-containing protein [Candidatus Bathyarchaeota archaeon]
MSNDMYTTALNDTLTEIKKICPDINYSFIFTKNGTIIAGNGEAADTLMKKTVHSFQSLTEKAVVIGGLQTFSINGEKGKLHISRINDMYLAVTTSPHADTTYLHSVTNVIVPTVLKLLENIAPTPLQFTSSQQLVVDTLTGFFTGDSVQIDDTHLKEWSQHLNGKNVNEVELETIGGKKTQCGVKKINDPKRQGKELILIPEKTCRALQTKKGELVKVKPVAS